MDINQALRLAALRRRLPPPDVRQHIRRAAGLSQLAVAEACHVTPTAVCRWESGKRTPRGMELARYVALLDRLIAEAARG